MLAQKLFHTTMFWSVVLNCLGFTTRMLHQMLIQHTCLSVNKLKWCII